MEPGTEKVLDDRDLCLLLVWDYRLADFFLVSRALNTGAEAGRPARTPDPQVTASVVGPAHTGGSSIWRGLTATFQVTREARRPSVGTGGVCPGTGACPGNAVCLST